MSEDEVAATFSFLTVEDLSQDSKSAKHRSKAEPEDVDSHFNKVRSNPSNLYSLLDSNDKHSVPFIHIHVCTYMYTCILYSKQPLAVCVCARVCAHNVHLHTYVIMVGGRNSSFCMHI